MFLDLDLYRREVRVSSNPLVRLSAIDVAPDRLDPLAQAGEKTNAGDPHLAACGHFTNSLAGKLMRSAQSHSPARNSGLG